MISVRCTMQRCVVVFSVVTLLSETALAWAPHAQVDSWYTGTACEPLTAENDCQPSWSNREEEAVGRWFCEGYACSWRVYDSYRTLDVDRALTQRERLHGARVELVGRVRMSVPMCTRQACSWANPCCNRCFVGFALEGLDPINRACADGALVWLDGLECRGSECDVLRACPIQDGDWISVWGRAYRGAYDGLGLEVHGYERIWPNG